MAKRGQITMEALLLYGAAILVVLLAIAALTYFGVLDLGRLLPEKCSMEGTQIFTCEEWAIDKTKEEISVTLLNKGTKTVNISEASFSDGGAGFVSGCNTLGLTPPATTVQILPGQMAVVKITGCTINLNAGQRLKGDITLTHKFTPGEIEQKTIGTLSAKVS